MVAMLYVQLGEYSTSLLLTRLELTALGAAVAMLAAVLMFPVDTRRVTHEATANYLAALRSLLARIPGALHVAPAERRLSAESRALDDALGQLLTSARPLARPPFRRGELQHHLLMLSATAHFARNLAASADRLTGVDGTYGERVAAAASVAADHVGSLIEGVRAQRAATVTDLPIAELEDTGRRLADAGVPRDDPRRRLLRSLVRLDGVLGELSDTLAGVDAASGPQVGAVAEAVA